MPIRFSRSGSSFRSGATALVASAGLWFSSAIYAQTQPAVEFGTLRPAAQSQPQRSGQRSHQFSQMRVVNGQSHLNQMQAEHFASNAPANQTNFSTNQTSTTVTERVDLGNVSNQALQQLTTRPGTAATQHTNSTWSQAPPMVSESVRVDPQTTDIIARLTAAPVQQPTVATVAHVEPVREVHSGNHQLTAISMHGFEQKLVNLFGDQLKVSTSDDGRFVRITLPVRTTQNVAQEPVAMLVDRKTGKLQYEGTAAMKAQWHQLISKLDSTESASQSPVVNAGLTTEISPTQTPQIQQTSFQEESRPFQGGQIQNAPTQNVPTQNSQVQGALLQGGQVRDIPGLSGPVSIARDASTGALILTGDKTDVEIVKREIARLTREAQSAQPTPFPIPLQNARGNLIQARVQEIYDNSYESIHGPANISAIDNPNSLVVVGSPKAAQAVQGVVKLFDVPPSEGAKDFRTFILQNISSNDAATRLRRFFGQVTASNGDTRIPEAPIEVIPDFRSNQVTVKGGPAILRAAAEFLATIDVASVPDGAVNEVKVIPLKNALASDVAFVIQNAINGNLQGAPQAFAPQSTNQQQQQIQNQTDDTSGTQSQLRSAMLSFMTRNEQGELIKSGILFDVAIAADANSNSLIVTGPTESIPLIVELVKRLDRIPDAESQLKVFTLIHSDAQTIFDMLDSLFNSQTQNAGAQQGAAGGGGISSLPLQTGGGSDGASLINLNFSIEPRSNSIIAAGPARDLQIIEDLLNRLDARAVNRFPTEVYRLSNAPAQDVADAINTYLDGRFDLVESDPRTATGVPTSNRTIIVTPEVVSNSLIVSALPEYLGEIERIIQSLDRRPPMIQVKVLIAEVDLDAVEEFGIELGIQDSLLFDRGTAIAAGGAITGGIGFPFNTGTIPNTNAIGRESFPAQALSNLNVGRVNSSLGYGGLVLSAGNESVNVLLRALKDRQCVRVLSSPQIMTMENLQGRVAIGASVARIAGSTTTLGAVTQNIEFQDVGVILEVTPRVSPDGLIVLTVNAESSAVGPVSSGTAIGTAADGSIITAQQILMTEATTTLSARSGQTVVFSGLITENKAHSERGVPILSDLPVVGPLFKFESDTASRSELLIIMTPTLVNDDSDLAAVNNEAFDRMHWCLSDVQEVFGNTGFGADVQMGEAVETYYPDADPTGTMQPVIHNSQLESPGQTTFGSGSRTVAPAINSQDSNVQSARKTRWNRLKRR